jgi:hypothetical protein
VGRGRAEVTGRFAGNDNHLTSPGACSTLHSLQMSLIGQYELERRCSIRFPSSSPRLSCDSHRRPSLSLLRDANACIDDARRP